MVVIDLMQSNPVSGYYDQLWRAAVAVDAMCTRQGRPGIIRHLGTSNPPGELFSFTSYGNGDGCCAK